jgi:hypothetical protein
VEAYKRKLGLESIPIVVITAPVDIMSFSSVAVLVATIHAVAAEYGVQVGLLVLDTFAKAIALGGGDEAKDQNRALGHLRLVEEQTDVHIAMVGHTGKDEARGARGSNAYLGDVDMMTQISGDALKTATITKANDRPEGVLTSFSLESFELGCDEDNDAISTASACADIPDIAHHATKPTRLNHGEQVALTILRNAVLDAGKRPPANNNIPPNTIAVTKDLWRRYCYLGGISAEDTTEDARKKAFGRAVKSLQQRGLIGVREPLVWVATDDAA